MLVRVLCFFGFHDWNIKVPLVNRRWVTVRPGVTLAPRYRHCRRCGLLERRMVIHRPNSITKTWHRLGKL